MVISTLRIGFIGGSMCSAVGYAHAVACQMDGIWQLVSGCFSTDSTKSRETGDTWGLPQSKIYTDWSEYINNEKHNVDAVVVLTPTPSHDQIVCALLKAGVAVICEKAMAATIGQSINIQQALRASKGFLAVTFNYSGYPMLRVLRQHVLQGDLGQLKQIQIEMPSDGFIQAPEKMNPQAWRLQDGEIPTILLDLAVHLHHLCGFVTNLKPLSVNADFHHDSIFESIVDDAYLWAKYEQGVRASMWVSKSALGHRNGLRIRIFGDKASAQWYQEEPEKLDIFAKNSVKSTYDRGNCLYPKEIRERFKPGHPAGFVEAFANLYQDIASALTDFKLQKQHKSPYVFGWEHAHEGLEMLAAATKSNQRQQWVDLAERNLN